MATKYFADQFDDEEVLYVFHRHPVVMRKGLVLAMFGPLIGIMPAAAPVSKKIANNSIMGGDGHR